MTQVCVFKTRYQFPIFWVLLILLLPKNEYISCVGKTPAKLPDAAIGVSKKTKHPLRKAAKQCNENNKLLFLRGLE